MTELDSIDIHIQRTPHVTATDFDFFDSMVRDSRFDIYAPELDGADETVLAGIRKIANGDSKIYRDVMSRTEKSSMWAQTFSSLFMIKKPIESFDVTQEQHQAHEVFRSFGNTAIDLSRITSSELIDTMPSQLERLPTFITARDTIIAQNIFEKLPHIIENNSKLQHLARIGLLMTIGDNHRLVHTLLTEKGFTVTTNDIPVTGAHEKAGLKYLEGEIPSEGEVLEAAAYNIVRSFVTHDSTYELRTQLNAFVQNATEDDIAVILSTIRKHGVEGIQHLVTDKLQSLGIETGLAFAPAGSRPAPIRPKETYERRGGMMGIRTSIF